MLPAKVDPRTHAIPLLMPSHHPSAQALADLLIGDCSPGAALLVGRHVEACAQCASRVQAMGAVGGPPGAFRCTPAEMLAPGVEIARVTGASGLGEAVFHLRVQAGELLPLEELLPVAEVLVLEGGLGLGGESYGPGDFLSLENRPATKLVADAARGCACLLTCLDAAGLMSL